MTQFAGAGGGNEARHLVLEQIRTMRRDATGSIRTLTIDAKVRLAPNDNRENENAPAFRVCVGQCRIGDAWEARSSGDNPKYYLRVRFDDPSLSEPINAALFPWGRGERK